MRYSSKFTRTTQFDTLSLEEKNKYWDKLSKRQPTTELQRLAQKENYALFVLMGMKSNLHHLKQCSSIRSLELNELQFKLGCLINQVKSAQDSRKRDKIVLVWAEENKKDKQNG